MHEALQPLPGTVRCGQIETVKWDRQGSSSRNTACIGITTESSRSSKRLRIQPLVLDLLPHNLRDTTPSLANQRAPGAACVPTPVPHHHLPITTCVVLVSSHLQHLARDYHLSFVHRASNPPAPRSIFSSSGVVSCIQFVR